MVALALVIACGGTRAEPTKDGPPPPKLAVVHDAAVDAAPAKPPGEDLLAETKLVYRLVACTGDAQVPAALTEVIDAHCKQLAPYMDKYREKYLGSARAWFLDKEPKDLPATLVYLFGGGDLISALVPFPDVTEITTVSLELSGDPRGVGELAAADLEKDLHTFRQQIGYLVVNGSNSSINLSNAQRNVVPAQLASDLLGLAAVKAELVSVRYFTLNDDGTLHYLEKNEIESDTNHGKSLRGNWKSPSFAQSFANVEVQWKLPGETKMRVHRHIAWNLDDKHLKDQPQLLKHLEAKGKVAVLVKGASYLLWLADFSRLRTYVLDHLAWMLSDSTGIPPNLAHGVTQETYGVFKAPIIDKVEGKPADTAMRDLFKHPKGSMPFRYGYLDKEGNAHVMITRPK